MTDLEQNESNQHIATENETYEGCATDEANSAPLQRNPDNNISQLQKQLIDQETEFSQKRAQFKELFLQKEKQYNLLQVKFDQAQDEKRKFQTLAESLREELENIQRVVEYSDSNRTLEQTQLKQHYEKELATLQQVMQDKVEQMSREYREKLEVLQQQQQEGGESSSFASSSSAASSNGGGLAILAKVASKVKTAGMILTTPANLSGQTPPFAFTSISGVADDSGKTTETNSGIATKNNAEEENSSSSVVSPNIVEQQRQEILLLKQKLRAVCDELDALNEKRVAERDDATRAEEDVAVADEEAVSTLRMRLDAAQRHCEIARKALRHLQRRLLAVEQRVCRQDRVAHFLLSEKQLRHFRRLCDLDAASKGRATTTASATTEGEDGEDSGNRIGCNDVWINGKSLEWPLSSPAHHRRIQKLLQRHTVASSCSSMTSSPLLHHSVSSSSAVADSSPFAAVTNMAAIPTIPTTTTKASANEMPPRRNSQSLPDLRERQKRDLFGQPHYHLEKENENDDDDENDNNEKNQQEETAERNIKQQSMRQKKSRRGMPARRMTVDNFSSLQILQSEAALQSDGQSETVPARPTTIGSNSDSTKEADKLRLEVARLRQRVEQPCEMCENYEAQLQTVQSELGRASAVVDAQRRELGSAESQRSANHTALDDVRTRLARHETERAAKMAGLSELIGRYEAAHTQVVERSAEQRRTLIGRLEAMSARYEEVRADWTRLGRKHKALCDRLERAERDLMTQLEKEEHQTQQLQTGRSHPNELHQQHQSEAGQSQQAATSSQHALQEKQQQQPITVSHAMRRKILMARANHEQRCGQLERKLEETALQLETVQLSKLEEAEHFQTELADMQEKLVTLESIKSEFANQSRQLQHAVEENIRLKQQQQNEKEKNVKNKDDVTEKSASTSSVEVEDGERRAWQQERAEMQNQIVRLQIELENSESVQKDFVRLSQTLQIQLERLRQQELADVRWQRLDETFNCFGCNRVVQPPPPPPSFTDLCDVTALSSSASMSKLTLAKPHSNSTTSATSPSFASSTVNDATHTAAAAKEGGGVLVGPDMQANCFHCGKVFCAVCLDKCVPSGPRRRPAPVCQLCHHLLVKDAVPYFSEMGDDDQDPQHDKSMTQQNRRSSAQLQKSPQQNNQSDLNNTSQQKQQHSSNSKKR